MLPYKAIRLTIARGLKVAAGVPTIPLNDGGDMPAGSFLTYTFSDFGESDDGRPIITQEDDKVIRSKAVTFTISILSYADSVDDSVENAMKAQDWFKVTGAEQLRDTLDVVVVLVGEVQNRDINIGEEWERRQGFDVDFRATDTAITDLSGWIETAIITKE
ncbi:phage neck terminator protein [Paenibacillus rhizophilus]|uniref:Phage neck terminator protein gp12-like domain-containing protein n=1 Tax=Paenibacillus rhizophilus TaxID=1850366 RepID=A0A3N9PZK5_9BACL|nr:hypothetical protein [Paenibacillus rhizophilus]RQW11842.1 hypothetical protein EH198_09195 [Paenibacillus rhizophilus]